MDHVLQSHGAAVPGAAAQVDQALATRILAHDSPWGRRSAQQLREWRNTLFFRVASFYKQVDIPLIHNTA